MKKKTAPQIKKLYLKLIEGAPCQLHSGAQDVLFIFLYMFVKNQISREELVNEMKDLSISGLVMAYLLEEIENKKKTLSRYKLSVKYGLS